VFLGAPLGALVGAAMAAVGGLIIVVLRHVWDYVFALVDKLPIVKLFMVILIGPVYIFVGFCCLAVPWYLLGMTTAWSTTAIGKLGKNRNVKVAALLSSISGILSLTILWLLAHRIYESSIPAIPTGIVWVVLVIIGLLVIGGAITGAFIIVKSEKFCETCELYMRTLPTNPLSFGSIKAMAKALKEDKVNEAADLLHISSGDDGGKLQLFTCPRCECGYVELTAKIKVSWNGGQKEESWLVSLRAITTEETAKFRSPLEKSNRSAAAGT
jgi:hypothetical protein